MTTIQLSSGIMRWMMYNLIHDVAHDWFNETRLKQAVSSSPYRSELSGASEAMEQDEGGGGGGGSNKYGGNIHQKGGEINIDIEPLEIENNILVNYSVSDTGVTTRSVFEKGFHSGSIDTIILHRSLWSQFIAERKNDIHELLQNNYQEGFIYFNEVVLDPLQIKNIKNIDAYGIIITYNNGTIIKIHKDINTITPIVLVELTIVYDNEKKLINFQNLNKDMKYKFQNFSSYINYVENTTNLSFSPYSKLINVIDPELDTHIINLFTLKEINSHNIIPNMMNLIGYILQRYFVPYVVVDEDILYKLGDIIVDRLLSNETIIPHINYNNLIYYFYGFEYIVENYDNELEDERHNKIYPIITGIYDRLCLEFDNELPRELFKNIANFSQDERIKENINNLIENTKDISVNNIVNCIDEKPGKLPHIDANYLLQLLQNILNIFLVIDSKFSYYDYGKLMYTIIENYPGSNEKYMNKLTEIITYIYGCKTIQNHPFNIRSFIQGFLSYTYYQNEDDEWDDMILQTGGERRSMRTKKKKQDELINSIYTVEEEASTLNCNYPPSDLERIDLNIYLSHCKLPSFSQEITLSENTQNSLITYINRFCKINLPNIDDIQEFFFTINNKQKKYINEKMNFVEIGKNISILNDIKNNYNIETSNIIEINELLQRLFNPLNTPMKSNIAKLIKADQIMIKKIIDIERKIIAFIRLYEYMFKMKNHVYPDSINRSDIVDSIIKRTSTIVVNLLSGYIEILESSKLLFSPENSVLTKNDIIGMRYIIAVAYSAMNTIIENNLGSVGKDKLPTFERELIKQQTTILRKLSGGENYKMKEQIPSFHDTALISFIFKNMTKASYEENTYFFSDYFGNENSDLPILDYFKIQGIQGDVSKLFYINNAVNSKKIGTPVTNNNYFCPLSSIIDAQSSCPNVKPENNPEFGNININITDGSPEGETISLNVTTQYNSINRNFDIGFNLRIGGFTLSDVLNIEDINNSKQLQANYNIVESMKTVSSILNNFSVSDTTIGKSKFELLLQAINNKPEGNIALTNFYLPLPTDEKTQYDNKYKQNYICSSILSFCWKKFMGDFLQELNTVAENSGYNKYAVSSNIVPPNGFRLGLANDRPSAVRMVIMTMFAKQGIKERVLSGYLNYDGRYLLALKNTPQVGGRIKKYKKKSKRNNRKTRKRQKEKITKFTKDNKQKKKQIIKDISKKTRKQKRKYVSKKTKKYRKQKRKHKK